MFSFTSNPCIMKVHHADLLQGLHTGLSMESSGLSNNLGKYRDHFRTGVSNIRPFQPIEQYYLVHGVVGISPSPSCFLYVNYYFIYYLKNSLDLLMSWVPPPLCLTGDLPCDVLSISATASHGARSDRS